ncbi:hypothetical protein MTO96_035949 [Rhipicephalus appendiculatus]
MDQRQANESVPQARSASQRALLSWRSRSVTHYSAPRTSLRGRRGLHLADIYDAFRGRTRFVRAAYRSPRFNGIRLVGDNTPVMEPVIPPLTARDGTGADRCRIRLLARRHVRLAMGSMSVNAKPRHLPGFRRGFRLHAGLC